MEGRMRGRQRWWHEWYRKTEGDTAAEVKLIEKNELKPYHCHHMKCDQDVDECRKLLADDLREHGACFRINRMCFVAAGDGGGTNCLA